MAESRKQAIWSRRVLSFERSGLTRVAWCRREGVSAASLDYWRRRFRAVVEEGGRALVPIMVSDACAVESVVCAGILEIEVGGGVRLRADARLDAQWLASVLRGLR